jgi:hypothetical protein
LRTYVDSEERLEVYREGVYKLRSIFADGFFRGAGINFMLNITAPVDRLKRNINLVHSIREVETIIPEEVIRVWDPLDRGPGVSARQALCNPAFFDGVVANVDLDQYFWDTEEGLRSINEMFERMIKDDCLWGVGSRDVPVRLGYNEEASSMRIIHELVHSLAIGSDKLKVEGEVLEGVLPAYAAIGESTGMPFVNCTHQRYSDLVWGMVGMVSVTPRHMGGWASEYFGVLRAVELDKRIATGYVKARENPFDPIGKDEEIRRVEGLIVDETGDLARSCSIRRRLEDILLRRVPNNVSVLEEYFDLTLIDRVSKLMLAQLQ